MASNESFLLRLDCSLEETQVFENIAKVKYARGININSTKNITIYEQLPKVFTTIENWPLKTNLRCWNCTLSFKRTPIFAPSYICYLSGSLKMGVHGVMCSFPCLARWLVNNHQQITNDLWEALKNAHYLYQIMYGATLITSIELAPPFTELKPFGGSINCEDFPNIIVDLEKKMHSISIQDPYNRQAIFGGIINIQGRNLDENKNKFSVWDTQIKSIEVWKKDKCKNTEEEDLDIILNELNDIL